MLIVASFEMLQAVKAGQGKEGKEWREGSIRCTFEDKILMSDIVFLRAWTKVDIPKFFNPVTTLLQAKDAQWKGMKTVGELRRIQNVPVPVKSDSLYKVLFSFINCFIVEDLPEMFSSPRQIIVMFKHRHLYIVMFGYTHALETIVLCH